MQAGHSYMCDTISKQTLAGESTVCFRSFFSLKSKHLTHFWSRPSFYTPYSTLRWAEKGLRASELNSSPSLDVKYSISTGPSKIPSNPTVDSNSATDYKDHESTNGQLWFQCSTAFHPSLLRRSELCFSTLTSLAEGGVSPMEAPAHSQHGTFWVRAFGNITEP